MQSDDYIPSEADTSFSWKKRRHDGQHVIPDALGIKYIDEKSSISFKIAKCEIQRVMPDRNGRAVFPSTEPSTARGARNEQLDSLPDSHPRLSHCIR